MKNTNELSKMIINFINEYYGEYKGSFSDYSLDEKTDVIVEYEAIRGRVWNTDIRDTKFYKPNREYKYEGSIYLKVTKFLVGSEENNEWERMYDIDDVPTTVWESLFGKLETNILNYFDCEVDFTIDSISGISTKFIYESEIPERLDEIGKLIAEFINDNLPTFETPLYSSFGGIAYDVYIEYHTNKVSVWNEKDIDLAKSNYHGTVHIIIDRLLAGNKKENTWERMYDINDISEYIWDKFTKRISEQVNKYFDVNVDCKITFKREKTNESILIESTIPEELSEVLFDVMEDYSKNCEFFEDSLDYAETIIDYTVSRAVNKEIINPTTDNYLDDIYEKLFDKYSDILFNEYESLCENNN